MYANIESVTRKIEDIQSVGPKVGLEEITVALLVIGDWYLGNQVIGVLGKIFSKSQKRKTLAKN